MYREPEQRATGEHADLLAGAPALEFDDWLDTPDGMAWLDNMDDARSMSRAAQTDGTRPGLNH